MKKIMIIVLLIISMNFVSAIELPEDNMDNQVVINKIDKEHKDTRQFINSEFEKSKIAFFNDFDKRAQYYEMSYQTILQKAVFKLILAWFGTVLLVNGFFHLIRIRLEKKKYNKLKKSLKIDLKKELVDLPKEVEEQNQTLFFKDKMMKIIKGGDI